LAKGDVRTAETLNTIALFFLENSELDVTLNVFGMNYYLI